MHISPNKYEPTELVLQDGSKIIVMTDKAKAQQAKVPEQIIDVEYKEIEDD